MSEVSTAPINATSTNTVPISSAGGATPKPAPKVVPKFESKAEETLWRINEPAADETEDVSSMTDIIDKAQGNAGLSSKEANTKVAPADAEQQTKASGKEKYTVNGKEYELDAEQSKRFVQMGIMHQLKNRDIANQAREVATRDQQARAMEQKVTQTLEALKQGSMDVLVELHGEEKAREIVEGWLRPKIERELMPPEQRQQIEHKERADRAEAELAQIRQSAQEKETNDKADGFVEHYQKVIISALDQGGVPKTAHTAKEMAEWMERGLDKGIEYTPQQLAQFVREDNIERVSSLTESFVSQIAAANKSGDMSQVVKAGESLVGILGEPVMYAIGKYYLARMKGGQPLGPQQVLDTPKVRVDETARKKPYLTMDEQAAERKRRVDLMEQGIDPGEWK